MMLHIHLECSQAASILSAIHYHTFDHLAAAAASGNSSGRLNSFVLYPTGVVIVLVGVAVLAHHTVPPSRPSAGGDSKLHVPLASSNSNDGEEKAVYHGHSETNLRVRHRKDLHGNHNIS